MKKITFVLLILICSFSAFSQRAKKPNPYRLGIGAGLYPTLDQPFVVDFKFYTKGGHALEFIGYNLQNAYRLTTLFMPYFPINHDGSLRMVVGPGVHVGVWKNGYKTDSYSSNPIVGVDGILGMEYKIPKLPLSFQLHYQPSADLAGNNEYYYDSKSAGAVVRFTF